MRLMRRQLQGIRRVRSMLGERKRNAVASRARTSFRCGSLDSVVLCRFLSTVRGGPSLRELDAAGWRIPAFAGMMGGVWSCGGPAGEVVGGWYVSRMRVSPGVVVSPSRHSPIIVREFCSVKYEPVDLIYGRPILANRDQSMPVNQTEPTEPRH